MSNKIVPIGNLTRLDGNPDVILNAAIGKLEGVVISGFTKDGELWAASSYADGGTVMWLLEATKTKMMSAITENYEE